MPPIMGMPPRYPPFAIVPVLLYLIVKISACSLPNATSRSSGSSPLFPATWLFSTNRTCTGLPKTAAAFSAPAARWPVFHHSEHKLVFCRQQQHVTAQRRADRPIRAEETAFAHTQPLLHLPRQLRPEAHRLRLCLLPWHLLLRGVLHRCPANGSSASSGNGGRSPSSVSSASRRPSRPPRPRPAVAPPSTAAH